MRKLGDYLGDWEQEKRRLYVERGISSLRSDIPKPSPGRPLQPWNSLCSTNIWLFLYPATAEQVQHTGYKNSQPLNGQLFHGCGERGIRTPGTVIPYGSLANCWFQPLTHLTLTEIVLPAIADRPRPRKQDDKVKSNLDICQINFNDCRLS